MRPTSAAAAQILRRLLAGDPDAPADLVEAFLDPLIASLRFQFRTLPDPTLADSAAIDALLDFVKNPGRYSSNKGSLWGYLYLAASRDLINALNVDRRRHRIESPLEDVELLPPDRNNNVEEMVLQRLAPDGLPADVEMGAVLEVVDRAFSEPQDRALLQLLVAGAFRTEDYAAALGISDRSEEEQRRVVKRAKDRITVKLRRIGSKLRERSVEP